MISKILKLITPKGYTPPVTNEYHQTVVNNIFNNLVWPILGVIAVFAIIYGGYLYMTAAGNPEQVDKAKKVLIYAIIGIVVALLTVAILQYLVTNIGIK